MFIGRRHCVTSVLISTLLVTPFLAGSCRSSLYDRPIFRPLSEAETNTGLRPGPPLWRNPTSHLVSRTPVSTIKLCDRLCIPASAGRKVRVRLSSFRANGLVVGPFTSRYLPAVPRSCPALTGFLPSAARHQSRFRRAHQWSVTR